MECPSDNLVFAAAAAIGICAAAVMVGRLRPGETAWLVRAVRQLQPGQDPQPKPLSRLMQFAMLWFVVTIVSMFVITIASEIVFLFGGCKPAP